MVLIFITTNEYKVLGVLKKGIRATPTEIAEVGELSIKGIYTTISRMEARGLIEVGEHKILASKKIPVNYQITKKGEKYYKTVQFFNSMFSTKPVQ